MPLKSFIYTSPRLCRNQALVMSPNRHTQLIPSLVFILFCFDAEHGAWKPVELAPPFVASRPPGDVGDPGDPSTRLGRRRPVFTRPGHRGSECGCSIWALRIWGSFEESDMFLGSLCSCLPLLLGNKYIYIDVFICK